MNQSGSPFASSEAFEEAFLRGLERLVEESQLGAFILVLANATFEPSVMEVCGERLKQRFGDFTQLLQQRLRAGRSLEFAEDDLQVFYKLHLLGLAHLAPREIRRAGGWEVQFNLVRSFRPQRASGDVIRELHRPFSQETFHFNKPFLRKEVFWAGELQGRDVRLLYNKFPFARYHGLLVADGALEIPQFLTVDYHYYIWQLALSLGGRLPGLGLGYNALGAGASVNHLHFQSFLNSDLLPVECPDWQHNGGNDHYPLPVWRYEDVDQAWIQIERCHAERVPYNLLYRSGVCYLMKRGWQGSAVLPDWLPSVTWLEAAGSMTCFNRDDFTQLGAEDIDQALKLVGEG